MTQYIRTTTPELQALLNSGVPLLVADVYTIVAPGGLTFKWADLDVPVTFGTETWSMGPGIKRGRIVKTMGLEGSSIDLELFDGGLDGQMVAGEPLIPWIIRGGLDGARVVVQQVFSAGPGLPWVGMLHAHEGHVSDVQTSGRGGARLTVRSFTEVFNRPLPPTVYQPKCRTRLYSALCGQSRSSWTVSGQATSASNGLRLQFGHALQNPAGHFDLGVVTFTGGANFGVSRTVRQHTAGLLVLMQPLPFAVAVNDTFEAYPGCNLTLETCTNKFNNKSRFRGFPFIPPPDSVT
jgi:uncharacterized phage protein (TIGR02218 family)